jgi:hypothetical protein
MEASQAKDEDASQNRADAQGQLRNPHIGRGNIKGKGMVALRQKWLLRVRHLVLLLMRLLAGSKAGGDE